MGTSLLDPAVCASCGHKATHKHQCITEREKRRVEWSENVHFEVRQWILTYKSFPEAEGQVSIIIDVCKIRNHTPERRRNEGSYLPWL